MNVMISVGTRFPAPATSMGRVLLAGLESQARAEVLDRFDSQPLAHETIVTRAALEVELDRVREQGYAVVDQEPGAGLRSVARRCATFVAASNLAAQAARVSVAEITRSLLDPLLRTAAAIEPDLGAAEALRRF